MPIDLQRTEEIFATSTDLTVGLEEEFALLDPQTLDLNDIRDNLRSSHPSYGDVTRQGQRRPLSADARSIYLCTCRCTSGSSRSPDISALHWYAYAGGISLVRWSWRLS